MIWNLEGKQIFGTYLGKFDVSGTVTLRVASDYDGAHYVGTAIKEHFGVEE